MCLDWSKQAVALPFAQRQAGCSPPSQIYVFDECARSFCGLSSLQSDWEPVQE